MYLFEDTIKNNIKFGKPDASDEEIIAAAKAAQGQGDPQAGLRQDTGLYRHTTDLEGFGDAHKQHLL